MGWNKISAMKEHNILDGIDTIDGFFFYTLTV